MNQTPLPIVSVIVPVYNEIDNVDLMYHELLEALQSQQRSFEIVLVDDGSIDGTTAKLEQVAEKVREAIENEVPGDLLSIDLRNVIDSVGEITGEISNDEMLGNIFSNFCIGK